jgi:hypothetical protein
MSVASRTSGVDAILTAPFGMAEVDVIVSKASASQF